MFDPNHNPSSLLPPDLRPPPPMLLRHVAPSDTEAQRPPKTSKQRVSRVQFPPCQDPTTVCNNFKFALQHPAADGHVAFDASIDLRTLRHDVSHGRFVGLGSPLYDSSIEVDMNHANDEWRGLTKIIRLMIKQGSGLSFTYHDTRLNGKRYQRSSRYHCSQRSSKSKPPGDTSSGNQRYPCRGILTIDAPKDRDEVHLHFSHFDHDLIVSETSTPTLTPSAGPETASSMGVTPPDDASDDRDSNFDDMSWFMSNTHDFDPELDLTGAPKRHSDLDFALSTVSQPPPLPPTLPTLSAAGPVQSLSAAVNQPQALPLSALQSPSSKRPRLEIEAQTNLPRYPAAAAFGFPSLTYPNLLAPLNQHLSPSDYSLLTGPEDDLPPPGLSTDDLERAVRTFSEAITLIRSEQQRRALVMASAPTSDFIMGSDPLAIDLAQSSRSIRALLERAGHFHHHR